MACLIRSKKYFVWIIRSFFQRQSLKCLLSSECLLSFWLKTDTIQSYTIGVGTVIPNCNRMRNVGNSKLALYTIPVSYTHLVR